MGRLRAHIKELSGFATQKAHLEGKILNLQSELNEYE